MSHARHRVDRHDADLMLKVYDLRREAVLRASRDAINRQFWPRSYDDITAVAKLEHPLNAPYRQTATYWEMVYGIAKHGIVDADYWIEGNGEGLFLFARVLPYLDRIRADFNPRSFENAEWMSQSSDRARELLGLFRKRVQAVLAAT